MKKSKKVIKKSLNKDKVETVTNDKKAVEKDSSCSGRWTSDYSSLDPFYGGEQYPIELG